MQNKNNKCLFSYLCIYIYKNLQTLLTKARLHLVQRPTLSVRNNGLYTCQDNRCLLHKNNYIIP